jgi:hypothetical protein
VSPMIPSFHCCTTHLVASVFGSGSRVWGRYSSLIDPARVIGRAIISAPWRTRASCR